MKAALGTHARRLPRYRPHADQAHRSAVDDAVGAETDTPTIHTTTAPGDGRKLRGIPAIGYGVAGAIPGTNPLEALLDKDDDKPLTC